MSADTFDSVLGLILQGVGNNNNNWGAVANISAFTPAARAIAGVNTISSTGGTVDLSTTVPPAGLRLDIDHIQLLTGALTADLTIKVPNVSKTWHFWNTTTGAFNVFVQVPSGAARPNPTTPGGLVQIPQNCRIEVICDGGGHLIRHDDDKIGDFAISARSVAGPGEIICSGQSLLKAEFPDLYGKVGVGWGSVDSLHFTLPNFTDTNRYLRAGGGSGPAVGTYQSNQNAAHTHTVTGAPGAGTLSTDTQGSHSHSASVTDPTHVHGWGPAGAQANVGGTGASGTTAQYGTTTANNTAAATGISVGIGAAGSHSHNITGAPSVGTLGTASQGGSEARPESAAVLICIRY